MSIVGLRNRDHRPPMGPKPKAYKTSSLILSLLVSLLPLGVLFLARYLDWPSFQAYRYLCLVPVFYVAYQYGLVPALISSGFFSAVFLPELYSSILRNGLEALSLDLVVFILFINIFAYVVAEMAASLRLHQELTGAVRDWEALMATTWSLDEVISLILQQAGNTCNARINVLLLRNPLDMQWEMITSDIRVPLRFTQGQQSREQNLAEWLVALESPMTLQKVDQDPRFEAKHTSHVHRISTLLARPLRHQDQTLIGMLVLLNKESGEFTSGDQRALDDLVARSEHALQQAGLHAQTDQALARRVQQLAAIQAAVRQLNATLDPEQIVEQTLDCALEITRGDAGLVSLDTDGLPHLIRIHEPSPQAGDAHLLTQGGTDLNQLAKSAADSDLPLILPQAQSRLLASIERRGRDLGYIIVESDAAQAFGEIDSNVLATLADHAAIALENARLLREIRKEKERVSLIIHSVADGLFTTDQDRRILTLNPAAEQITGWQAQESVGKYCWEVLHCADWEVACKQHCPLLQAIREGRFVYNEKLVIHQRQGLRKIVSLSAAPLLGTDDQPYGAAGLLHDITKQEETSIFQKEFIASISHELRGSLSKMIATAETIKAEFEEKNATDGHGEYLDSLLTQSQRLVWFADSLLDLFRLETGHVSLQPRPLPLVLLLEEVIQSWKHSASHHSICVHVPKPSVWIWADEKGIQVVLNNLIENAIKYSPQSSEIDVTVQIDSDGRAVIAVHDQGRGIAPRDQGRIFERFYRVNANDAQTISGQGLGLYIARKLTEAMGGEIWVESDIGKGSKFAVALPMLEESHEEDPTYR